MASKELVKQEIEINPTKKLVVTVSWCKACGICVAFCPTGALAKDETGNPYVKDIGKCIRCGWCEIRCPDFAITVGPKNKRKAEGKGEEAEPEERTVAAGQ